MSNRNQDVETVFLAALKIDSAAEREQYLRDQCGDNLSLRQQVEELLVANANMGAFLDGTKSHLPQSDPIEQIGQMIGPYKLMDQIGEGGMGIVYIAEQREPVKRRVALKIIKPGMDTREVMARFAAERQALAMMEHPNIAQVLDAGETDAGRPFFVMELVNGVSITEFCDENKLSYKLRLELFIDVCHAIQHAHQKGVIHRDIKPSNVLVSFHDQKPVVKVIDFGVAKAINQPLTDKTVFTQVSQLVGTPMYMSPEQAGKGGLDIDTRSDIYSLGVLLYELLTGETPFDRKRLGKAALDEIRRIIREEDPPRPSTRISTLGDVSTISEHRNMDPKRMQQALRGDIDWIIMKSLEKERSRRYETANGFAMDIQRYLREEPVLACPPSTFYRLSKFARRNRKGVIAASLVAGALLLGLAGTMSGMVWAWNEKVRADDAATLAESREKTTRGILDFMISLFEEASPQKRLGEPMTVQEFLDLGASRIDELSDQPDTLATLKETIGSLYVVLSEYEKSEPLLLGANEYRQSRAESSEQDELAHASVLVALASLYQWTNVEKAVACADQASKIYESRLGDSAELADSLNLLGNSVQRQDRLDDALVVHERSLAIREKLWPEGNEKHVNVATALHNIGIIYFFKNELENAEHYYQRAINIEKKYSAPDDPSLATAKHVLSIVFASQSKFENAKRWQLESFETRKKVFPANHDHVGLSNNWLGNIYRDMGRYSEAEPLLRKANEIHTEVFGEGHGLVFWDRLCLLKVLVKLEKFDEAIQLQKELNQYAKGSGDWTNLRSVNILLGDIQFAQGNLKQSRETYLATMEMFGASDEKTDFYTTIAKLKVAVIDAMQGAPFSRPEFESAIQSLITSEKWSEGYARLLDLQIDIADALFDAGDRKQAALIYANVKKNLAPNVESEDADPFLINHAARFLVSCKQIEIRDPKQSLMLAQRANNAVDEPAPHYLATLAMAQFEVGEIDQAIATQQLAIDHLPKNAWWRERFENDLDRMKASH